MSSIKIILFTFCFILCIGGCSVMKMNAQNTYPNHPIELIVPFSAGGGFDIQARLLEKFISQNLNQSVVVINKPGAAGTIGWNEIVHAKKDGYTLCVTGTEVLLHTLYQPNKTHYFTTIDPIAQISTGPRILVVNASQPWKDLNDVIKYAKENPKNFKYGNAGIGSLPHIISETFGQVFGVHVQQVPFQGGGESIAALLGNHVQFAFLPPSAVKEHIKAGTLRAIATTGENRWPDPIFAAVPTFKELGFDLTMTAWFGIGAPKELPPRVKATLEEGLKQAIADPEFQEYMQKAGMEIEYLGNEESRQKWVREIEKLKEMLESTGILEEVRSHQQ